MPTSTHKLTRSLPPLQLHTQKQTQYLAWSIPITSNNHSVNLRMKVEYCTPSAMCLSSDFPYNSKKRWKVDARSRLRQNRRELTLTKQTKSSILIAPFLFMSIKAIQNPSPFNQSADTHLSKSRAQNCSATRYNRTNSLPPFSGKGSTLFLKGFFSWMETAITLLSYASSISSALILNYLRRDYHLPASEQYSKDSRKLRNQISVSMNLLSLQAIPKMVGLDCYYPYETEICQNISDCVQATTELPAFSDQFLSDRSRISLLMRVMRESSSRFLSATTSLLSLFIELKESCGYLLLCSETFSVRSPVQWQRRGLSFIRSDISYYPDFIYINSYERLTASGTAN